MHSFDPLVESLRSVPDRPSNLKIVRSCSLLNGLEPVHIDRIVANSFSAYAERGETLWMAGTQAEFCGVVGIGFVKMTKSSPAGTDIAVELLGPGQAFGLMAVVEGRDFPLSSVAVTNCWYLKIPAAEIRAVYAASMQLKDLMVRNIGPRLRKAHEMMGRFSSGKVEERIAAVLFILADGYGRPSDEGIRLEIPLTRAEISEMAGTTTETVIRVLSRWQKQGLLATDRQVITILDTESLAAFLRGG